MLRIFITLYALLFILAEPAHSEPVTIALFGAAFAATTAGAAVTLGLGIAFNIGVSLLAKALFPQKEAQQAPRGVTLDVKMGDDQPIQFPVGTYATAGIRKYIGTWGNAGKTPNAYLTDVIEISSIPVSSAGGMWVDDTHATILWDQPHPDGRGYPVQEFRVGGGDFLWVKFALGGQTAADPFLIDKFGSHPDRPFSSTMIGRGCGYAIVTTRLNQDLFSGQPNCLFEPGPTVWYDLRKDSTNGGSGSQRWNTPSTWLPTDNNAIIIYNLIRGVYYGTEWVYGGQNLAAFRLPASNWIAAANECDVLVDRASGGQEKQYRCGYEIRGDIEPLTVIDDLRMACSARIAEVGGTFKILVGAPGAAVYSFTDGDIVVTDGQSLEPFPSIDETFNGVEATYPEPLEKWATKDAPARYSPTLEAQDGDRRLASGLQFPAAPFGGQVQRLMLTILEEQRRFRVHQFFLPPDAYALEPNDVVAWTSSINGYVNKKFLVVEIEGEATFCQLVTLKELDPTDYDWSSDDELDTSTGWLGPITPPVQPMYGWTATPAILYDASGNARRPSIKVGCAPDQDDVAKVWVQVRLKSSGAIVFDSDATPYAVPYEWVLNGTFLPTTVYQVRGKFVPYTRRQTEWSDWIDVTTLNVKLSPGLDFDPYVGTIGLDSLGDDLRDYQNWLGSGRREILERLEEISLRLADKDFSDVIARKTLREQITATRNGITADYIREVNVLISADAAMTTRIETLTASVNKNRSEYVDQVKVLVDSDTAIAQSIISLSSTFGLFQTSVNNQLVTLSDADQALSLSVSQLQSGLTDAQGNVTANSSAITALQTRVTNAEGDIDATADLLSDLEVSVGKFSASGRFRTTVEATPSGALARVGLSAAASSGGATSSAAMYLDALAGGLSRVVFEADQFIVVAGGNLRNPFVVDGTAIRMNVANIGTVNAGTINFGNGRVLIDATGIRVTA